MRRLRPALALAVLLVACASDPGAAPEERDEPKAGAGGSSGAAAGQPNGGASGASSAGSGGVSGAGQAGASGSSGQSGNAGATAGKAGASGGAGTSGQGGSAAGQAGKAGAGGGVPQGGSGGSPPPDVPSACQPKQLECTCGPSGFGACVADPKDADARVCDCKASAKPKESDAVLTCDAAKAKYPSVSWQAIKTTCPETEACMAMAPEQAEDLSSKWGDRFCRHYPNPADPIGGINEGPGKQIYQYCCKPVAPLLPTESKQEKRLGIEVLR